MAEGAGPSQKRRSWIMSYCGSGYSSSTVSSVTLGGGARAELAGVRVNHSPVDFLSVVHAHQFSRVLTHLPSYELCVVIYSVVSLSGGGADSDHQTNVVVKEGVIILPTEIQHWFVLVHGADH